MIRTKYILLLIALTQFFMLSAAAQSLQTTQEYRVVAVKKGDLSIKSTSNDVEMVEFFNLYIPNTFTPNGDEINDTFTAVSGGLSTYSMLIYNKWGELLYETDDIYTPWDGTYHGEIVQSDSYVYKIFAAGTEMGEVYRTGTVTVML